MRKRQSGPQDLGARFLKLASLGATEPIFSVINQNRSIFYCILSNYFQFTVLHIWNWANMKLQRLLLNGGIHMLLELMTQASLIC